MRTFEPPRSLSACLPLIGLGVLVGCQAPPPPATATSAPRFEIPVAGRFEPHTEGNGTKAQATSSAPEPAAPGLPERLPIAFTRQQLCEQGTCSLSGWLPDPSYADSPLEEIAAQAAIWVHVFGEQAKVTLPPNAALELLVVGLGGRLGVRDTLSAPTAPSPPLKLEPWSALRASGAGAELSCESGECRAMFALVAPDSTLQSAVRAAPTTNVRATPLELRAFLDSTAKTARQDASYARVLFGGSASEPPLPFSLTLLHADAPARIAAHAHAAEWENLLVLEARGDLELRGRSYPIAGGESLHIAPGVRHGYVARGNTSFVALQLYTPAGPEQRWLAPSPPTPAAAAADGRTPPEAP